MTDDKKSIELGRASLEEGTFEPARKTSKSKYDEHLALADQLEAGRRHVSVPVGPETSTDEGINALRTAIKRRTKQGKLQPGLIVRRKDENTIAISRQS